ncbi:unnamed protein product, partial [marine sediment metagenome]
MTEELQAENIIIDDEIKDDDVDQLNPDGVGSELAPDTGENQEEKITFDDGQQKVFNEAIGKKTAKLREMERRAEEAEQRAKDLEAKIPKQTRPEVPPLPDPYSENYEDQCNRRDKAIADRVSFDSQEEAQLRQEKANQQQAERDSYNALVEKTKTYTQRSQSFGMKAEDLQAAGKAVADYGISEELGGYILQDPDGPLITAHLASNPIELDNIRSMDIGSAAVRIENVIKPQLEPLKPKPS